MLRVNAKEGDLIKADGWTFYEKLNPSDGFSDSGFKGCDFRVRLQDYNIAVNVITTGKPIFKNGHYISRCKIEFVGDCEPSEFSGGYLIHENTGDVETKIWEYHEKENS